MQCTSRCASARMLSLHCGDRISIAKAAFPCRFAHASTHGWPTVTEWTNRHQKTAESRQQGCTNHFLYTRPLYLAAQNPPMRFVMHWHFFDLFKHPSLCANSGDFIAINPKCRPVYCTCCPFLHKKRHPGLGAPIAAIPELP